MSSGAKQQSLAVESRSSRSLDLFRTLKSINSTDFYFFDVTIIIVKALYKGTYCNYNWTLSTRSVIVRSIMNNERGGGLAFPTVEQLAALTSEITMYHAVACTRCMRLASYSFV